MLPLDTSGGAGGQGGGGQGGGGAGGLGGLGGGGAGATSNGGGGTGGAVVVPCGAQVYACGDTIDNDLDGLIDELDPDCLGPCDDTEDSWFGNPGPPGPACVLDCYFDENAGAGNDDCHWNHQCDPLEVAPLYYPEPENGPTCGFDPAADTPGTAATCAELEASQSQACIDKCMPLVPNGCDCFGCCELPPASGKFVWLGSVDPLGNGSCTQATVDDPEKCHPCTHLPSCFNDCKTCELCIGKPELPAECGNGGAGGGPPVPECGPGVQPCGVPGLPSCPMGFYCATGCCRPIPG